MKSHRPKEVWHSKAEEEAVKHKFGGAGGGRILAARPRLPKRTDRNVRGRIVILVPFESTPRFISIAIQFGPT